MNFDFGELKNDSNFTTKVQASHEAVAKIEKFIKDSAEMKIDELSPEDRVKYDLFLIYAVNSLYWMYLKIDGDNPNAVSCLFIV